MLQDSTMQMMSDSLAMDSMMRASEQAFQDAMNDPALQEAMGEAVGGGLMGMLAMFAGVFIFVGLLSLFMLICNWMICKKAGKPGWSQLVPIYGSIVFLQICGRPWWWLLLCMLVIPAIIFMFILPFDLAKSFGKGTGFGLGILFLSPIFIAILAFGDAKYVGPGGVAKA